MFVRFVTPNLQVFMPMIDVTAVAGTFADKRALTVALAKCMMRWEQVPEISLFLENTAAFIHELPTDAIGNAISVRGLEPVRGLLHAVSRSRPSDA